MKKQNLKFQMKKQRIKNKGGKKVKKLLKGIAVSCFLTAFLCSGITVSAESSGNQTFTDKMLTYEIVKDGVNIIDCEEGASALSINEEIDNFRVIGIEEGAFADCTKLREVTLPDSIIYMGEGAFSGCTALEKINFPAGMTEIPAQTFAMCDSLKEIEIPDTIKTINQYAFSYCQDLTWFEIPKGVTTINSYAFALSKMPETLDIPENVKTIEDMAFFTCEGLKTVNIPATIDNLAPLAFLGSNELNSYNVDSNNKKYSSEYGVLYSENSTILESYPAGKDETSFTVPDTVEFIAGGAFFANSYLTEINLSDNITQIGEAAFSNCTALEKMTLPDSIISISPSLFCDCTSLWSVTLPEHLDSIGAYAFLECTNLQSLDIPDSVTEIGEYAMGYTDDEEGNFHSMDNFIINANYETAARTYAKDYDVDINYINGNPELPKYIMLIGLGVVVLGIIVFVVARIIIKRKKENDYYKV